MNLLGAITYDPSTAASKATTSLLAMTAFDTTNLRLTVTVPASGKIWCRMRCAQVVSAATMRFLFGVLSGSAVVGRCSPMVAPSPNTGAAVMGEFMITGQTPGASVTLDAAYAVQVVLAASSLKYGGPDDTSGADAWGAFSFELYDPQPQTTTGQLSVDANGRLDISKIGGTTQTARDLGASVLLSSGTGTGQLDFTSGVVKSNLVQILATALTETAGFLAAGFKKFFNITTPVMTVAWVDQTGDNYARIGAPVGASISADVAAVKSDTGAIKTKTDSLTFTGAGKVDASVRDWVGDTIPARSVTGVPKVDPSTWDGTDITTGVPLAPTTPGRTLDVSAAGEAGIDWANIGGQSSIVALSGTTIATATVLAAQISAINTKLGTPVGATVSADIAAVAALVSGVPAAVWASGSRTLTSFGTLVADVTAAVWASVLETGFSASRLLRGIAGAAGGKSSGGGTTFRNASDTDDALTGTVDATTKDRTSSTWGA